MRPAFSTILFFLPLAFAINFSVPSNLTSGGPATISWTSTDSDPDTFSMELVNPNQFHNAIAIANNVQKTAGSISVTLPIVPAGDGYTIEAVDISNINSVFGTSGDFSIGATVTTTSSTSTSTTSSISTSGSVTTPAGSTSTSAFGVTVTTPLSGSSRSSSGTSSSSSSSASSNSFNGNGAMGSYIGSGVGGSIAAAVVGVIAGAVFV